MNSTAQVMQQPQEFDTERRRFRRTPKSKEEAKSRQGGNRVFLALMNQPNNREAGCFHRLHSLKLISLHFTQFDIAIWSPLSRLLLCLWSRSAVRISVNRVSAASHHWSQKCIHSDGKKLCNWLKPPMSDLCCRWTRNRNLSWFCSSCDSQWRFFFGNDWKTNRELTARMKKK